MKTLITILVAIFILTSCSLDGEKEKVVSVVDTTKNNVKAKLLDNYEQIIYDSIPIRDNYEGDENIEILGWSKSGRFAYIYTTGGPQGAEKYFYISDFNGNILDSLKFYGERTFEEDNSNLSEIQLNNKCSLIMKANEIISYSNLNFNYQSVNKDFSYLGNTISLLQSEKEFRILLKDNANKTQIIKQIKRETSYNPMLMIDDYNELFLKGLFFNPQDKMKLIVTFLKVSPHSGFENADVGKISIFCVDLSKI
jgi:hypothetical protein